jgi:hypothetical protein
MTLKKTIGPKIREHLSAREVLGRPWQAEVARSVVQDKASNPEEMVLGV